MLATALVFAFTALFFLVIAVASLSGFTKCSVDSRLSSLFPDKHGGRKFAATADQNTRKFLMSIGKRVAPTDEEKSSLVRQRLIAAGFYGDTAPNVYWGIKIALTTIFPILVLTVFSVEGIPLSKALVPSVIGIVVGMMMPEMYLYLRTKSRRRQIFEGLPDMLDLLLVCVESGLGLDAALQRVSEEFHIGYPVLNKELNMTCAAIRLGHPRCDALRELGDRSGVADMKSLATVLIQADRFGTSTAQALRVHAKDMRTRRKQKAEEVAAKTAVKLIFPLVLFIFPAIFVVLAGPAILRIAESMMNNTV